MKQDRRFLININWGLILCLLTLFFVGVGNLYSASSTRIEDGVIYADFYKKQLIWGSIGFMAMLVTMFFDYRKLRNMAWVFFAISLVLLICVPFIGKTVYGAKRWLDFGFITLQPSEIAKLAVLVLAARLLSQNGEPLGWKDFFYVFGICCLPILLVLKQPDLGTAALILFILGGMVIFHGLRKYVLKTCLVLVPCLALFMWFVGMHDYQRQRIFSFLNPDNDPRGAGYHTLQSRIAIGSGEIWGKGFGDGTQSQLRFLPERHSDFAVAVFGEEWGFIGCVVLIVLFCLFLLAIYSTAAEAKDRFGCMLVVGVFFYFFCQIFINMGMVIGIMPVVGVPLPFISYGGSATIVNFALIGIVLSVSMRRFIFIKG